MKTTDINATLIDSYFSFLKDLSADSKLELISRLSKSMKTSRKTKKEISLDSLYGSWESEQSADEIIADLKSVRDFNRKREVL
jgi:hypothetical protein